MDALADRAAAGVAHCRAVGEVDLANGEWFSESADDHVHPGLRLVSSSRCRSARRFRSSTMKQVSGAMPGAFWTFWVGLPWSRRQESNLYLPLRRRPFYPL